MERCSVFLFESTAIAMDLVPGAAHSADATQAPARPDVTR